MAQAEITELAYVLRRFRRKAVPEPWAAWVADLMTQITQEDVPPEVVPDLAARLAELMLAPAAPAVGSPRTPFDEDINF